MYASARDYLGLPSKKETMKPPLETDLIPTYFNNSQQKTKPEVKPVKKPEILERSWEVREGSTSDPKIWGPAFWFTLHVSAAHYPEEPNPIVQNRMKHRILAIPYEIPCAECRQHAISFVEYNKYRLPEVVSSRNQLVKFYVDFHNTVNRRQGKPEWTYEKALSVYSGKAKITYMK